MTPRPQRTIARPATVDGFGLFGGQDVRLRFLPAPPNHGIAFQRIDLPARPRIPALIQYVQSRPRRTAVGRGEAVVETIEHVLAALAGLRIDNCLVQLDALEPPAGDGSARAFTAALTAAGIQEQHVPRRVMRIEQPEVVRVPGIAGEVHLAPAEGSRLTLRCDIDYAGSSIGRQSCEWTLSPDSFLSEIAEARTFILESEIAGLRAQGYGRRVTTDHVLVFGPEGPIDNSLRFENECARHKLLDCLGDLALLGCDLHGVVAARHGSHALNQAVVRRLAWQLRRQMSDGAGAKPRAALRVG